MIEKLKEAAKRADEISSSDDRLIMIKLRSYGFLIDGHREIEGEDKLRLRIRQVPWSELDDRVVNPLLLAVESVDADLGK